MSARPPFTDTRKVLTIWAALLIAGLVLVEGFTVALDRHAQRLRENDYRTYLGAATRFIDQNDFPSAMAEIEKARGKAPNAPEPYIIAGHVHYRLKHWEQAISSYDLAIVRGSRDEGIRLNTVWAFIELERYDEAVRLGKQAMVQGFSGPGLPRYIAEACFRAGQPVDSIAYFELALEGYPNDLYLLDHLKQAYNATGRDADAQKMEDRIAEVERSLNSGVAATAP